MSDSTDFIVVGGGVMGLMLARELLSAGASVTLVEAGQCGREASWAGGGIVSPLYPWRYSPAVTALAEHAKQAFPVLCEILKEETGIDPEYTITGLLMMEADDKSDALQWASRYTVPLQVVDAEAINRLVPACAGGFSEALWMPDVANVRNPRLLQALLASLKRFPDFCLREFEPVLAIEQEGNGVRVVSHRRRYSAAQVVVCAGAWSARLVKDLLPALPVVPVCGQMLLYQLPPGLLATIVLHEGRYLIPRVDGHVLVGSTLEMRGFDQSITQEALASLRASAQRMMPALRECSPVRQWAGLRPGAPEGIPLMGRVPCADGSSSNVWVCAGHYRNGLVLSPASTQLMADLIVGRNTSVDPGPYALHRAV